MKKKILSSEALIAILNKLFSQSDEEIKKLTDDEIKKITQEYEKIQKENLSYQSIFNELLFARLTIQIQKEHISDLKKRCLSDSEMEIETEYYTKFAELIQSQATTIETLKNIPSRTARAGGLGKAAKALICKEVFLRMVEERTPAWSKTKEGLAEAVLELKPAIVKYARDHQKSVITASTNLPKKWLEEHWKLEKRAYTKKRD